MNNNKKQQKCASLLKLERGKSTHFSLQLYCSAERFYRHTVWIINLIADFRSAILILDTVVVGGGTQGYKYVQRLYYYSHLIDRL